MTDHNTSRYNSEDDKLNNAYPSMNFQAKGYKDHDSHDCELKKYCEDKKREYRSLRFEASSVTYAIGHLCVTDEQTLHKHAAKTCCKYLWEHRKQIKHEVWIHYEKKESYYLHVQSKKYICFNGKKEPHFTCKTPWKCDKPCDKDEGKGGGALWFGFGFFLFLIIIIILIMFVVNRNRRGN